MRNPRVVPVLSRTEPYQHFHRPYCYCGGCNQNRLRTRLCGKPDNSGGKGVFLVAIFTPGPLAAAISGSIGGTVFSRNRGGTYVRNRSIPVDPNTIAQQEVRAILATQSSAWADQTDAVRAAFQNWAVQNPVVNALGHSILLSGQQAFVQINARLAFFSLSPLTSPPIINAPDGLSSLDVDGDIGLGDVDLTFGVTPLPANIALWIRAAVVNSAGVSYVRNKLRFVLGSATAQASPLDIQTQVEAKFGTLVVGQTLHVRVSTFDTTTGLLSVGLEDKVVITTT